MSPLGKAFALAALFCPLVWAVECELDEECEIAPEDLALVDPEDETSLLQTQQNLKIGRERWPIGEEDIDDSKVYFRKCEQRSPFCDMRLNLKDQMTYEIEWVLAYLRKFGKEPQLGSGIVTKFGAPDAFTEFAKDFKEKLEDINKREGRKLLPVKERGCKYLHTHKEFKAHLTKESNKLFENVRLDPGGLGQFYTNWMSNLWVNFKFGSDAITDAGETGGTPAVCSWTQGDKAWGTTDNNLKEMIRTGFMWKQGKGRGTAEDRLSMTSGAPRNILNFISAGAWIAEYNELKNDTGRKNEKRLKDNHACPLERKAALPGVERWAMTFKNRRLGFFAYGDTPPFISEVLQTQNYFFEEIVHGFGIHGRNRTAGNPADRMRYVGMPWIGGVSGSVVDFYIAAKKFGFSGKTLTDMVMSDVAFLAAAGQHSVSELVFACTSIFLNVPQEEEDKMNEDSENAVNEVKAAVTAEEESDDADSQALAAAELLLKQAEDEQWRKKTDYDDKEHPFKIKSWRQLVTIMNTEGEDWKMDETGKKDHDLPALFTMAMREFMQLSNHAYMSSRSPFGMEHTLTAILGELEGKVVDSGSKCLEQPGLEYFKKGMENRGGIHSAFKTWTSKGASEKNNFGLAFDGEGGLTEAQFIELISGEGGFGSTLNTEIDAIIANIENTRIRSEVGDMENPDLHNFATEKAGASKEDLETAKSTPAYKKFSSREAVMKLIVKNAATNDPSNEEILKFTRMDDASLIDADDKPDTAAIAAKKLLRTKSEKLRTPAPYTLSKDFSLTVAWQVTITEKLKDLYQCLTDAQKTPSSLKKDGISAFYWTAWKNDQPFSGHSPTRRALDSKGEWVSNDKTPEERRADWKASKWKTSAWNASHEWVVKER